MHSHEKGLWVKPNITNPVGDVFIQFEQWESEKQYFYVPQLVDATVDTWFE